MMRLHSSWAYLEQQFGCSLAERFLMAVRSFDNPKAVTPYLLERGERRFGLFLHVEKGNVEAARLPPDIEPIYYQPYHLFDPDEGGAVYRTLEEAMSAAAGAEKRLVVDRRLPVAIANRLSQHFSVELEAGSEPSAVTVSRVAPDDVRVRLGAKRREAGGAALRLLQGSPVLDRIRPFFETAEDRRYGSLDVLLAAAGLQGIVASSSLNVQEIAGVPMWGKRRPLAAVYAPGGAIWLIEAGSGGDGREYASPAEALNNLLPNGAVGIESEDVDVGLFRSLRLDSRSVDPADELLRKWRDNNTHIDLAFYVIAARASADSIQVALNYARRAIEAGDAITEMDAYFVYLDRLRKFVADAAPFLRVARTLTNFHTSARTIFPANPAPFPLTRAANTLKVDAGCLVFDREGTLLGCSDIARTLCLTDEAEEIYALEQHGVRDVLVPACESGTAGSALHAAGVNAIWGADVPRDNSLFVPLENPSAAYSRDVGHLLGKNNLSHLKFTPGETGILREGMIACCEYQWPYRAHAVAYEDTCLVTDRGGLNFTSDKG